MNLFLSLFIIAVGGILGGFIFEKIKLPTLVWYIFLRLLIGPSLLNIVDDVLSAEHVDRNAQYNLDNLYEEGNRLEKEVLYPIKRKNPHSS